MPIELQARLPAISEHSEFLNSMPALSRQVAPKIASPVSCLAACREPLPKPLPAAAVAVPPSGRSRGYTWCFQTDPPLTRCVRSLASCPADQAAA